MDTIKLNSGRVKMIAHRGLSGLEQENTCAAFVAAGNRAKYFGIETDVHRTADGRFLVFHDDDTARVGLDRLVLEQSTFQSLRSLQLTDLDGVRAGPTWSSPPWRSTSASASATRRCACAS